MVGRNWGNFWNIERTKDLLVAFLMGWSQPCIVWLLARIYWELLPRSDFRTCDRSSLQLLRYTLEWAISIALINVSSWMTLYLCQDSWFSVFFWDVASAWYPKQPFFIGCFTCMNQIFAEKWLFRVRIFTPSPCEDMNYGVIKVLASCQGIRRCVMSSRRGMWRAPNRRCHRIVVEKSWGKSASSVFAWNSYFAPVGPVQHAHICSINCIHSIRRYYATS